MPPKKRGRGRRTTKRSATQPSTPPADEEPAMTSPKAKRRRKPVKDATDTSDTESGKASEQPNSDIPSSQADYDDSDECPPSPELFMDTSQPVWLDRRVDLTKQVGGAIVTPSSPKKQPELTVSVAESPRSPVIDVERVDPAEIEEYDASASFPQQNDVNEDNPMEMQPITEDAPISTSTEELRKPTTPRSPFVASEDLAAPDASISELQLLPSILEATEHQSQAIRIESPELFVDSTVPEEHHVILTEQTETSIVALETPQSPGNVLECTIEPKTTVGQIEAPRSPEIDVERVDPAEIYEHHASASFSQQNVANEETSIRTQPTTTDNPSSTSPQQLRRPNPPEMSQCDASQGLIPPVTSIFELPVAPFVTEATDHQSQAIRTEPVNLDDSDKCPPSPELFLDSTEPEKHHVSLTEQVEKDSETPQSPKMVLEANVEPETTEEDYEDIGSPIIDVERIDSPELMFSIYRQEASAIISEQNYVANEDNYVTEAPITEETFDSTPTEHLVQPREGPIARDVSPGFLTKPTSPQISYVTEEPIAEVVPGQLRRLPTTQTSPSQAPRSTFEGTAATANSTVTTTVPVSPASEQPITGIPTAAVVMDDSKDFSPSSEHFVGSIDQATTTERQIEDETLGCTIVEYVPGSIPVEHLRRLPTPRKFPYEAPCTTFEGTTLPNSTISDFPITTGTAATSTVTSCVATTVPTSPAAQPLNIVNSTSMVVVDDSKDFSPSPELFTCTTDQATPSQMQIKDETLCSTRRQQPYVMEGPIAEVVPGHTPVKQLRLPTTQTAPSQDPHTTFEGFTASNSTISDFPITTGAAAISSTATSYVTTTVHGSSEAQQLGIETPTTTVVLDDSKDFPPSPELFAGNTDQATITERQIEDTALGSNWSVVEGPIAEDVPGYTPTEQLGSLPATQTSSSGAPYITYDGTAATSTATSYVTTTVPVSLADQPFRFVNSASTVIFEDSGDFSPSYDLFVDTIDQATTTQIQIEDEPLGSTPTGHLTRPREESIARDVSPEHLTMPITPQQSFLMRPIYVPGYTPAYQPQTSSSHAPFITYDSTVATSPAAFYHPTTVLDPTVTEELRIEIPNSRVVYDDSCDYSPSPEPCDEAATSEKQIEDVLCEFYDPENHKPDLEFADDAVATSMEPEEPEYIPGLDQHDYEPDSEPEYEPEQDADAEQFDSSMYNDDYTENPVEECYEEYSPYDTFPAPPPPMLPEQPMYGPPNDFQDYSMPMMHDYASSELPYGVPSYNQYHDEPVLHPNMNPMHPMNQRIPMNSAPPFPGQNPMNPRMSMNPGQPQLPPPPNVQNFNAPIPPPKPMHFDPGFQQQNNWIPEDDRMMPPMPMNNPNFRMRPPAFMQTPNMPMRPVRLPPMMPPGPMNNPNMPLRPRGQMTNPNVMMRPPARFTADDRMMPPGPMNNPNTTMGPPMPMNNPIIRMRPPGPRYNPTMRPAAFTHTPNMALRPPGPMSNPNMPVRPPARFPVDRLMTPSPMSNPNMMMRPAVSMHTPNMAMRPPARLPADDRMMPPGPMNNPNMMMRPPGTMNNLTMRPQAFMHTPNMATMRPPGQMNNPNMPMGAAVPMYTRNIMMRPPAPMSNHNMMMRPSGNFTPMSNGPPFGQTSQMRQMHPPGPVWMAPTVPPPMQPMQMDPPTRMQPPVLFRRDSSPDSDDEDEIVMPTSSIRPSSSRYESPAVPHNRSDHSSPMTSVTPSPTAPIRPSSSRYESPAAIQVRPAPITRSDHSSPMTSVTPSPTAPIRSSSSSHHEPVIQAEPPPITSVILTSTPPIRPSSSQRETPAVIQDQPAPITRERHSGSETPEENVIYLTAPAFEIPTATVTMETTRWSFLGNVPLEEASTSSGEEEARERLKRKSVKRKQRPARPNTEDTEDEEEEEEDEQPVIRYKSTSRAPLVGTSAPYESETVVQARLQPERPRKPNGQGVYRAWGEQPKRKRLHVQTGVSESSESEEEEDPNPEAIPAVYHEPPPVSACSPASEADSDEVTSDLGSSSPSEPSSVQSTYSEDFRAGSAGSPPSGSSSDDSDDADDDSDGSTYSSRARKLLVPRPHRPIPSLDEFWEHLEDVDLLKDFLKLVDVFVRGDSEEESLESIVEKFTSEILYEHPMKVNPTVVTRTVVDRIMNTMSDFTFDSIYLKLVEEVASYINYDPEDSPPPPRSSVESPEFGRYCVKVTEPEPPVDYALYESPGNSPRYTLDELFEHADSLGYTAESSASPTPSSSPMSSSLDESEGSDGSSELEASAEESSEGSVDESVEGSVEGSLGGSQEFRPSSSQCESPDVIQDQPSPVIQDEGSLADGSSEGSVELRSDDVSTSSSALSGSRTSTPLSPISTLSPYSSENDDHQFTPESPCTPIDGGTPQSTEEAYYAAGSPEYTVAASPYAAGSPEYTVVEAASPSDASSATVSPASTVASSPIDGGTPQGTVSGSPCAAGSPENTEDAASPAGSPQTSESASSAAGTPEYTVATSPIDGGIPESTVAGSPTAAATPEMTEEASPSAAGTPKSTVDAYSAAGSPESSEAASSTTCSPQSTVSGSRSATASPESIEANSPSAAGTTETAVAEGASPSDTYYDAESPETTVTDSSSAAGSPETTVTGSPSASGSPTTTVTEAASPSAATLATTVAAWPAGSPVSTVVGSPSVAKPEPTDVATSSAPGSPTTNVSEAASPSEDYSAAGSPETTVTDSSSAAESPETTVTDSSSAAGSPETSDDGSPYAVGSPTTTVTEAASPPASDPATTVAASPNASGSPITTVDETASSSDVSSAAGSPASTVATSPSDAESVESSEDGSPYAVGSPTNSVTEAASPYAPGSPTTTVDEVDYPSDVSSESDFVPLFTPSTSPFTPPYPEWSNSAWDAATFSPSEIFVNAGNYYPDFDLDIFTPESPLPVTPLLSEPTAETKASIPVPAQAQTPSPVPSEMITFSPVHSELEFSFSPLALRFNSQSPTARLTPESIVTPATPQTPETPITPASPFTPKKHKKHKKLKKRGRPATPYPRSPPTTATPDSSRPNSPTVTPEPDIVVLD